MASQQGQNTLLPVGFVYGTPAGTKLCLFTRFLIWHAIGGKMLPFLVWHAIREIIHFNPVVICLVLYLNAA